MGFSRLGFEKDSRQKDGVYPSLITLRASTAAQGESGDDQPDWSGGATMDVRGRWRQTSQKENVMDGGKYSSASGVWEIPWVPDLTTEHRVEYGTRYYRIIDFENLQEQNRELHIFCIEDEGGKGLNG